MSFYSYWKPGVVVHLKNAAKTTQWENICKFASTKFNEVELTKQSKQILPSYVFFSPHVNGFIRADYNDKTKEPEKIISEEDGVKYVEAVSKAYEELMAQNAEGTNSTITFEELIDYIGKNQSFVNGYVVDRFGVGGVYFGEDEEQARFERLIGCIHPKVDFPITHDGIVRKPGQKEEVPKGFVRKPRDD